MAPKRRSAARVNKRQQRRSPKPMPKAKKGQATKDVVQEQAQGTIEAGGKGRGLRSKARNAISKLRDMFSPSPSATPAATPAVSPSADSLANANSAAKHAKSPWEQPTSAAQLSAMCFDHGPLASYGLELGRLHCQRCLEPILRPETLTAHVEVQLFNKPDSAPEMPTSWFRCSGCRNRALVCMGCGKVHQGAKLSPYPRNMCCYKGRQFITWLLMCGPPLQSTPTNTHSQAALSPNALQEQQPHTVLGSGVGYSDGAWLFEPGWHPNLEHNQQMALLAADEARKAQDAHDRLLTRYLKFLDKILPRVNMATDFDQRPPQALRAFFMRSPLIPEIISLLRNGSVDDTLSRSCLYHAVLDLLRTLHRHPDTIALLYTKLGQFTSQDGLLKTTFPSDASRINNDPSTMEPLKWHMTNFSRPFKEMLDAGSKNAEIWAGEDGAQIKLMCDKVCNVAAIIDAEPSRAEEEMALEESDETMSDQTISDQAISDTEDANEMGVPTSPLEELRAWSKENAVLAVDDSLVATVASTCKDQNPQPTGVLPGRMRRIMQEITTLQTSLPEGIYVRYGESQIDSMKVLIAGPKGTPYEDGLFEFDLHCPVTFPEGPPMMKFLTTKGGAIRFNPNLYKDGSVCLSLLGTWRGEPWIPNKSTLLQLLVSIQAMVFCEKPFYNEPGNAGIPGNAASEEYNQQISRMTALHAIREWLRNPHEIWAEVVDRHFEAHADSILETLETRSLQHFEVEYTKQLLQLCLERGETRRKPDMTA